VSDDIVMTDPEINTKVDLKDAPGGHPIELLISYVLRTGVLIAAALVAIGLVMFFVDVANGTTSGQAKEILSHGGHQITVSWTSIAHGVTHGDALSVIELGLLVLILTPVSRVLLTLVLFLIEKDPVFVIVSAIVLFVLMLGFLGIA
jgi:uncharacterized membrane protein